MGDKGEGRRKGVSERKRKHHGNSGQEMVEVVRASYLVLCMCLLAVWVGVHVRTCVCLTYRSYIQYAFSECTH